MTLPGTIGRLEEITKGMTEADRGDIRQRRGSRTDAKKWIQQTP